MELRIYLEDAEGRSLALTDEPDAPEVHEADTIRGMKEFLRTNRRGFWTDGDCQKHPAEVASFRVFEGRWELTDEVVDLMGASA